MRERPTMRELRRLRDLRTRLLSAIGWLDLPFIDDRTNAAELRLRIGFMMADRDAALALEKQADGPLEGQEPDDGPTPGIAK